MRTFLVSMLFASWYAEASLSSSFDRELYLGGRIFGYLPTSDVSDELMLDLDQYNIEEQLMQRKIDIAKRIYEEGGHSSPMAVLNLTMPDGIFAFDEGSTVWAQNVGAHKNPMEVQAILNSPIVTDGTTTAYSISVTYDRSQDYEPCQVGALYLMSKAALDNCKCSILN
jgi:hypothetical protein